MEYKGYKIIQKDNRVLVEGIKDFNLVHTFECGQCFRWIRQIDGSYTGVAKGRVINVSFAMIGFKYTIPMWKILQTYGMIILT